MKDHRMNFIQDIEVKLFGLFSPEQLSLISNAVITSLSDYEISERCTAVACLDDSNTKLLKRYTGCLVVEGKSKNTIYQYNRMIQKLSATINKPFTEMGIYDIRMFLAIEKNNGLSNRSVENIRAYLSAFFQWLTNEDIIDKNPIAKMKSIKYTDEVRKPFSDTEIDALRCACMSLKERALVEMLLSTGVRVNELASMRVTDVDFNTLTVHVVNGKGAKERMTYTNDLAIKYLKKYIKYRGEDGEMLFYNRNHQPLKAGGVRFILNQIAARANVENVHPHRFRRTFATNLSKRGMNIYDIQKLMGHSNINTTTTYICSDDSTIHASYNKYIA